MCRIYFSPLERQTKFRTTHGTASSVEADSLTRIRLASIDQLPQFPAQRGVCTPPAAVSNAK
jgi:hypothetical protein